MARLAQIASGADRERARLRSALASKGRRMAEAAVLGVAIAIGAILESHARGANDDIPEEEAQPAPDSAKVDAKSGKVPGEASADDEGAQADDTTAPSPMDLLVARVEAEFAARAEGDSAPAQDDRGSQAGTTSPVGALGMLDGFLALSLGVTDPELPIRPVEMLHVFSTSLLQGGNPDLLASQSGWNLADREFPEVQGETPAQTAPDTAAPEIAAPEERDTPPGTVASHLDNETVADGGTQAADTPVLPVTSEDVTADPPDVAPVEDIPFHAAFRQIVVDYGAGVEEIFWFDEAGDALWYDENLDGKPDNLLDQQLAMMIIDAAEENGDGSLSFDDVIGQSDGGLVLDVLIQPSDAEFAWG